MRKKIVGIDLLLGCTLLSVLDFGFQSPNDIYSIDSQCEIVMEVQEWIPEVKLYFKQDEALALTVMWCESKGKSTATGYNRDGTFDQGLFQFNNKTEEWLEKDKYKRELDMYDPIENIKAAAWLSYYDGWHHWNSSKHCWGKYDR